MTKLGCPEARLKPGSKGFCPLWQETTLEEKNLATGVSRFMKGCFYEVSLRTMEHVIHASNRPAEEMGKFRNMFMGAFGESANMLLEHEKSKGNGEEVPALEADPND